MAYRLPANSGGQLLAGAGAQPGGAQTPASQKLLGPLHGHNLLTPCVQGRPRITLNGVMTSQTLQWAHSISHETMYEATYKSLCVKVTALDRQMVPPDGWEFMRCGPTARGGLLSSAGAAACVGGSVSSGCASSLKVLSAAFCQNLLAASFVLGVGACMGLGITEVLWPAGDTGVAACFSASEMPVALPRLTGLLPGSSGSGSARLAASQKFAAAATAAGGRARGSPAGLRRPTAGDSAAGCVLGSSAAGGVAARWLS